MNNLNKEAAGLSFKGLKPFGKFILKHPVLSGAAALGTAGAYNIPISYLRGRDQTLIQRAVAPTVGVGQFGGNVAKELVKGVIGGVVDSANAAPEKPIATTNFSLKGLANTLNPASGILGGTDYVPQGVLDAFGPGNESAAHTAFKTGAIGLLAAALIGGYRMSQHTAEMKDLKLADRPSKGIASQVSTTFSGDLSGKRKKKKAEQAKTAAEVMPSNNFTVDTLMKSAIPTGALLLAGALAYKGVDEVMDRRRNKQLDKAIAAKEDAVKNLIMTRARVAKGTAGEADINAAVRPLNRDSIYVKEAGLMSSGVQTAGVLASAIVLASALGAYAYTSAGDENNRKYKAYKKALREYAKAKSGISPITMIPSDASSYFAQIDEGKKNKATTPREQPSYNPDALNNPISVTF